MNILRRCATLAALLGLAAPAFSAALHVAPVSLRLEPGQQAAGVTLTNLSSHALVAQIRVLAWSQDLAEDRLDPQQEVVASPPIVTVAAGNEQFVRIVRLDHAVPAKELTYRLLVDELPDPGALGGNGAVDIRVRYSIPLFVAPFRAPSEPELKWELSSRSGGNYMKVTNSGGQHAQLSVVKLVQPDGTNLSITDGLLGYALAGNSREWQLPPQALPSAHDLKLTALVNGKAIVTTPLWSANDGAR